MNFDREIPPPPMAEPSAFHGILTLDK